MMNPPPPPKKLPKTVKKGAKSSAKRLNLQMLITGKQLEIVHYITDSPFSQYRTKVMFSVVANRQETFGLQACWDYFEAGHGKGSCDGISGTAKKSCGAG